MEDGKEQPDTQGQHIEPQLREQPKPSASQGQGNSKDLEHEPDHEFQKSWNHPGFPLGGSKLQHCLYFQLCANASFAPCGFLPPYQGYKVESSLSSIIMSGTNPSLQYTMNSLSPSHPCLLKTTAAAGSGV